MVSDHFSQSTNIFFYVLISFPIVTKLIGQWIINIFIRTGDGRENGEFLAMMVRTEKPYKLIHRILRKLTNSEIQILIE